MNLRLRLNTITARLILSSIVIILFSVLIQIVILTGYLRRDVIELSSVQLMTIANYVARHIDNDIEERRQFLERVSARMSPPMLKDREALGRWLMELHQVNPLFSNGMFITDLSGLTIADYPVMADRVGTSFADRDYFLGASAGDFSMGRPVFGRVSGRPVLPMAAPLRDGDGAVCAVLAGISDLRSSNFIEALYTTRVGTEGGLVLVSPQDKLVIGASDVAFALKPAPDPGIHPQHDRAMAGFRGVGVDVNAGGIEELAAIASVPSSGWFVVARMPTSEVYAPVRRLRDFILKTTAIFVPFLWLLVVLVLDYHLRALRRTAQHAERMTRGEIPFEQMPLERDDEVGRMIAAFNRLLSRLMESRAEAQRQCAIAQDATRAKSVFLANMSHEIRTPMNAILGFSEILMEKVKDPARRDYLAIIQSSGRTLLSLIDNILDLSKIEAGKMAPRSEPFHLAALIRETCRMFDIRVAEKGIALAVEIGADIPEYVILDPVCFRQILINLIGNAVKFTESGHIRAVVQCQVAGSAACHLTIAVSDTGIGIPPDKIDAIFQEFEQVDGRAHGGAGLGLAITRRLVEMMDGVIAVESRLGKGSRFRVDFTRVEVCGRRSDMMAEDAAEALSEATPVTFAPAAILVVDDIPYNRELIRGFLAPYPIALIEAGDGGEALERLGDGPIDLVLTDIRMPSLNGFELLRAIRESGAVAGKPPVIAMTASVMREDVSRIQGAFDGYLAKPVTRRRLLAELKRFLPFRALEMPPAPPPSGIEGTLPAPEGSGTGPEEAPPALSAQVRARLPEILRRLNEEFMPLWRDLSDVYYLDDIETFAARLKRFSEECGIPALADYSGQLLDYARRNDTLGIDRLMSRFQEVVDGMGIGTGTAARDPGRKVASERAEASETGENRG